MPSRSGGSRATGRTGSSRNNDSDSSSGSDSEESESEYSKDAGGGGGGFSDFDQVNSAFQGEMNSVLSSNDTRSFSSTEFSSVYLRQEAIAAGNLNPETGSPVIKRKVRKELGPIPEEARSWLAASRAAVVVVAVVVPRPTACSSQWVLVVLCRRAWHALARRRLRSGSAPPPPTSLAC